jgi:hypothetical protein
MVRFKGAYGSKDITLPCVRWDLAYRLSLRQSEELRRARGVAVDHATIDKGRRTGAHSGRTVLLPGGLITWPAALSTSSLKICDSSPRMNSI